MPNPIIVARRRHRISKEDQKFVIVGEGTDNETIVPATVLVDGEGNLIETVEGRYAIAGYDASSNTLRVSGTLVDPDLSYGPIKWLDAVTTDTDGPWIELVEYRSIFGRFQVTLSPDASTDAVVTIELRGRMNSDDSDPVTIDSQTLTLAAGSSSTTNTYNLSNYDSATGLPISQVYGEYQLRVTGVSLATITAWLSARRN